MRERCIEPWPIDSCVFARQEEGDMTTTTISIREYERFTPSAQEAFQAAQRVALSMGAPTIDPEHLLLAIILQDDERVAQILDNLGMDIKAMRARVAEVAYYDENAAQEEGRLPLSRE